MQFDQNAYLTEIYKPVNPWLITTQTVLGLYCIQLLNSVYEEMSFSAFDLYLSGTLIPTAFEMCHE